MKKLKVLLICMNIFLIIIIMFFLLMISIKPNQFTGKSVIAGIQLTILRDIFFIIDSPINTTYNFNKGSNYTLNLNVSSPLNMDYWTYDLYDEKYSRYVYQNITFTPNTTFNAARWSNILTVRAFSSGIFASKNVSFFIQVPNSPPVIEYVPTNVLVCERSILYQNINVSDVDNSALSFYISPQDPFYIFPSRVDEDEYEENFTTYIISAPLPKSKKGVHRENITVSDGQYTDSKIITIDVIEINNAPAVAPIGVQTIWSHGENTRFYRQVDIYDIESGNSNSGNFTYNLTFWDMPSPLFGISPIGIMDFTANSSYLGVYNITLCVKDKPLTQTHANITLCGQNGSAIEVCSNFSLTVTDNNRAPIIDNWYPLALNLSGNGTQEIYFNVSTRDPDGTTPDNYWYFDDARIRYSQGVTKDNLTISLPCGVGGVHNLSIIVTDGELNASLVWNITVNRVACQGPPGGGGGGGGGGKGSICIPRVVCGPWHTCTNLNEVFKRNAIPNADYVGFKNACLAIGFSEETCGYQIRECTDLSFCNYTYMNESEAQYCEYVVNPNCMDGKRNCHNGNCEILVDCGGPCAPCATCSDGKKNQGEEDVDCGGPCPDQCPEKPLIFKKEELKNGIYIIISIILIILIVIIILRIIRIIKIKREIGELRWYELFQKKPGQL